MHRHNACIFCTPQWLRRFRRSDVGPYHDDAGRKRKVYHEAFTYGLNKRQLEERSARLAQAASNNLVSPGE